MTPVDDLFAEVRKKKLFVSNFYQGTDDKWRCWLRKKLHGGTKLFGIGDTAAEAMRRAIDWKPEVAEPPPSSIEDQFADLLG